MLKKKAFRSIVLLFCVCLSIMLVGCGSSGSGNTPVATKQITISSNYNTLQHDMDVINFIGDTNMLSSTVKINATGLKTSTYVKSFEVALMFGKNEVLKDTFSYTEGELQIVPNGSVSIRLSDLPFNELAALNNFQAFCVTGIKFTVECEGVPATSMTYNTTTMRADMPMVVVSAGQSSTMIDLLNAFNAAKIPFDAADVPTHNDLDNGVNFSPGEDVWHVSTSKLKKGTDFRSIVFTMGVDQEGIAASNMTFEDELARIQDNIDWAKRNRVPIIGVHLGGQEERGGDNEDVIDLVMANSDLIIVFGDGNADNKFSNYCSSHNTYFISIDANNEDVIAIIGLRIFGEF